MKLLFFDKAVPLSIMITDFILSVLSESYSLLLDASIYILFGIVIGGLLRVFLSQDYIIRHLGQGRFVSVFKAALLGIPIPLCSCGVLPAASALKKQGANNGATMAFLVSTPESGVDSICITYAILDPIMTVMRPIAAFVSAFVAGVIENIWNPPVHVSREDIAILDKTASDCGCDGNSCATPVFLKNNNSQGTTDGNVAGSSSKEKMSLLEKVSDGLHFAVDEIWADIAGWFFLGVLIAGVITVAVPDALITQYLGGGFSSMLLMLLVGIPLYICATASTPIAAALILKGVSPGAALVFLLVGPATNVTSLSVLFAILGKRATALYLTAISVVSVMFGLFLDWLYIWSDISVTAAVGQGAEIMPDEMKLAGVLIVALLSLKPLKKIGMKFFSRKNRNGNGCGSNCGCGA